MTRSGSSNRVIKFRAWDGKDMKPAFDLSQNPKYWWEQNKDYPLMQFTGLHDKNGVEIYEGDIVVGFREGNWRGGKDIVKGVVKYREQIVGYTIDSSGSKALHNGGKLHDVEELEVVGNIFQNGELLRDC